MSYRIYATCDIGQEALQRLRAEGLVSSRSTTASSRRRRS